MSEDERKTKAELIAEIERLRNKVADQARDESKGRQPTLGQDMSRRAALKIAWAVPVVLSVPIAGVVGRPQRAMAGTMPPTTRRPTRQPTTVQPTLANQPTIAFPTAAKAPVLSNPAAAAAAAALFGFGARKLRGEPEDEGGE